MMTPVYEPMKIDHFTEVHFDKDGVCRIVRGYSKWPEKDMNRNNDYDLHTDYELDGIRAANTAPNVGDRCHSHPELICIKKWFTRFVNSSEYYLVICEFGRPG